MEFHLVGDINTVPTSPQWALWHNYLKILLMNMFLRNYHFLINEDIVWYGIDLWWYVMLCGFFGLYTYKSKGHSEVIHVFISTLMYLIIWGFWLLFFEKCYYPCTIIRTPCLGFWMRREYFNTTFFKTAPKSFHFHALFE